MRLQMRFPAGLSIALWCLPGMLAAQDVAIHNATHITIAKGDVLGNIVVRGGKMTAVGANVTISSGIKVIDGTGNAFAQSANSPFVVPAWAFPTSPAPNPAPKPDSVMLHHVPNTAREYTMRQVGNAFDIPDWFPASHTVMPAPVQYGTRPNARACGFCHLPDGQGRPENSALAGLPVDYIVRQVRAFRDSTRLAANPASKTNSMHLIATSTSDADVAIAAKYFSKLRLTRRNIVREVAEVPKTHIELMLYAYDSSGTEPIDGRLIEVPESFERHELRDPTVVYTTYVAVGSIARGRRLAMNGPNGAATACATCHGPQLRGKDVVPPIAGRSPSNILRQLMNFRTGARHDSMSITMAPIVAKLSVRDMVSLSAYVGSRRPSAPAAAKRR